MLIERMLYKQIEPFINSPQAIIITGMRRVGKTSLLRFIFDRIESSNKLFLDLENPANQKYFEIEDYERIKLELQVLGLDFSKRAFLFLDEIHLVKSIPSVVKYLIDHYNVKCFLTGSASFYLKNLFSESLAGRKYIFELFPLTFKEFLMFKGSRINIPEDPKLVTEPVFDTISTLYEEYILFGGFPEVVLKERVEEKKKCLEDIFSSFFQMEVLKLGDFRKNKVVRDLIMILMERIGFKMDIQKLSRELCISRATLYNYISFLEDTYFIHLVRPFSRTKDVELRKTPKVYLCDSGLVNHFARIDEGRLFENNVFQNLKVKGEVNYYQKKSGVEIDFILDKKKAFEVKVSPSEREIKNLEKLSQKLGLEEFKMVSKKYVSYENTIYGFMI
jgi:predicted AAA+ superfamily ATPase